MGWLRWLIGRSGGDGSTAEQAIVVENVGEEYAWVQRHCPGFQVKMQMLQDIQGKPFDVLQLHNAQGQERTIYFDISRFFGKF